MTLASELPGGSSSSLSEPSTSTPAPTPTPSPTPSPALSSGGFGTYEKLFAINSPWNVRPVNPVLSSAGIQKNVYYPDISEGAYSTGIFKASPTDPPMTVYAASGQAGISDPDIGGYLNSFAVPHWPANVTSATGTDGHADIVDESTGMVYSFWVLRNDGTKWTAYLATTSPLAGRGWGNPAHYYQGARATGVPTSGGVIRKSEYKDGDTQYRHVLAMSMPKETLSGVSPGYVFPATSADWDYSANTGSIPEGALMMLPPDFNVAALHKADMQKVARTLMTYGARVVDRNVGTPYVIYVESGTGWVGHSDSPNYWDVDYASDLDTVRAALRMVSSQSGFIDNNGTSVNLTPDSSDYELFSLRGPWKLDAGSVVGNYDSISQSLSWGATGSTASVQRNTNGTQYGHVAWAKFVPGKVYKLSVSATGGAKFNFEIHNPSTYATLFSSGNLSDGQTVEFTWPNGDYVVPIATSGTNVSSSSLKISLTRK